MLYVCVKKFDSVFIYISDVFWNRMMVCVSSSGIMLWNVCGRIIRCMVWLYVMFIV